MSAITGLPVTSTSLHWPLARNREQDLWYRAAIARPPHRQSRRRWFARRPRIAEPLETLPAVTIRHAFPDDGLALLRLASLDSREPPAQPVLVAEVDGELRAALSLRDGGAIADPFHRTQSLIDLLEARATQLIAADARTRETGARRHAGRVLRFRADG